MRLLKLALISVVILFAVVFIISLFIPPHVRISRAVNITAEEDSIVSAVANLRQWKNWNQFVNDTSITNFVYDNKFFRSDQLQVELGSVKTDTIKTLWRRENGKEIVSGFTLHTVNGTTVVQWYFDFYLNWYPWEKFGSIIFDKQLGPPMEKSLANLKKLVEKTP